MGFSSILGLQPSNFGGLNILNSYQNRSHLCSRYLAYTSKHITPKNHWKTWCTSLQVAGVPPIPVTRTAFGLPHIRPPKNINLQTSRGRCSGGELLVSGRVAEKRATLRKTNAACEKWCFGRLLFLWAGRSICRGLYEFRGNYCSIIISYHIRIISQRGVRDSPLDEIECYLVPKHPRTFLF